MCTVILARQNTWWDHFVPWSPLLIVTVAYSQSVFSAEWLKLFAILIQWRTSHHIHWQWINDSFIVFVINKGRVRRHAIICLLLVTCVSVTSIVMHHLSILPSNQFGHLLLRVITPKFHRDSLTELVNHWPLGRRKTEFLFVFKDYCSIFYRPNLLSPAITACSGVDGVWLLLILLMIQIK